MSVPKLRFNGFKDNWITTQLGNICSFTQGVQIPQAEQVNKYKEGYIRYLYIRDFFTDKFKCYVPNNYPEKIIHPHEIMMVNTGNTTGEAYTGRHGVLSNNSFKIGYDLEKFNHKFMFLFCSSELAQNQIKKFFNAGGQPHLGHKNIAQILISYPKKEEQTKIASFVSAVDEKMSQLTQKHELLSQYKQGMMQKLFSQQIRFKADDGSEFGEWKKKTIKDIADINPKINQLPEKFIYIDLESVEKGKLRLQKYIELKDAPSRAQRLLAKGDVLFQMVRPYQQNNYYFNLDGDYVASTGYAQIRTNLNSEFIYYAIHEKTFLEEVMNRCTGTSYPAINSSDLSTIELLIPSLQEQTKIANCLSAIDQKIEVVALQIEQAKHWKKGLLWQMFV